MSSNICTAVGSFKLQTDEYLLANIYRPNIYKPFYIDYLIRSYAL